MKQRLLLTYAQLFMLASAQGFDGIAGLPEHTCDVSAEELMTGITALSKAGLVKTEGDSFVCTPTGAEIGRRLGGAKVFVTVRTRKRRLPDFSCFFGEELMLCTPSLYHADRISVGFVRIEELLAMLADEGYLPENEESLEPENGELELFESLFWEQAAEGALAEDEEIVFSMDAIGVPEKHLCSVRIVSYYSYRYLVEEFQGKKQRRQLHYSAVENALRRMLIQNDYC